MKGRIRPTRLAAMLVTALLVLVPTWVAAARARDAAKPTAEAVTIVTVKAKEFRFTLSTKTAHVGTVTFAVKNVGKAPHDFKINGKKTALLAPGKSAKLTVKFIRMGPYPYRCTVDAHAKLGMKGVFTLR